MIIHKQFAEIAGWYGVSAVLVAYFLVSLDLVAANGWLFQLLNLTGALGIIIISIVKKLHQTIALNAVWVAIALFVLIRLLF